MIKGVCQILTPIPAFLIQVIIAGSIDKREVTIFTMAFIVLLLSWMGPTLVIRSQVLIHEGTPVRLGVQAFGHGRYRHHFPRRSCPTCCRLSPPPWWARCLRPCSPRSTWPCSVSGPLREPLLGNIIWSAQTQGAFFNGWWWWPIIPAVAMVLILFSLALINMGLDELANPRVRRTE